MIKALLFDLDGVIVDTAVYHYKAWKRLANELGFDFTEEQNESLKGVSRIESLARILAWGDVEKNAEERESLATKKNSWYVDMISQMTPAEILPGTREFIEAAREKGYKIALGSASKNSGLILERTELAALFDEIVDGNTVTHFKPNPEVFLQGARALGVNPADCLVFEDAFAGIEAARRAGMKSVGIGSANVLRDADIVVSGLDKLTLADIGSL
ncbi:MAG: beta-phosphoglucomutase [Mucilaginibacter polytrichastri]|nr:beta-phosphoglucomutase [Mucilaginibacter polytrichastri]